MERMIRVCAIIGLLYANPASAQWTPSTDRRNPNVVLEGNWQSCKEVHGAPTADDVYSERVYEHVTWIGNDNHHIAWTIHLGPKDEFAVFKGDPADHPDHDSAGNLLTAFRYRDVNMVNGVGRSWTFTVERRSYLLNVKLAGGSREDCESYWIKLEHIDRAASK